MFHDFPCNIQTFFKWGQKGCLLATRSESFCYTVAPRYNEPRYNEDPVMTNNI